MDKQVLDAVVLDVLSRLSEPLTLERIAERAGFAPHHLHRQFKRYTGETLAKFVERHRLSLAAEQLVTREDAVVDVALANGYANHETFSRAFRRYHGVPPSAYASALWQKPGARQSVGGEGQRYRLSASRRCRLRSASILTKRHTGPYESVPRALWSELQRVARIQGVVTSSLVGIGWDDPGTTAPEALRFDAGLVVQERVTADAPCEMGRLPGGDYAVTLHVGPHATLTDAYPEIGRQVGELPGVRFREGAVVEMYHGELLGDVSVLEFTEVYLPVGV